MKKLSRITMNFFPLITLRLLFNTICYLLGLIMFYELFYADSLCLDYDLTEPSGSN